MDVYGSTPIYILVIYQAHIHHTSQIYKTQMNTSAHSLCTGACCMCECGQRYGNDMEMHAFVHNPTGHS